MKVTINLTVEVDTEGWTLDYGVEGKAAIRADVKEYVMNVILQSNENLKLPDS